MLVTPQPKALHCQRISDRGQHSEDGCCSMGLIHNLQTIVCSFKKFRHDQVRLQEGQLSETTLGKTKRERILCKHGEQARRPKNLNERSPNLRRQSTVLEMRSGLGLVVASLGHTRGVLQLDSSSSLTRL